MVVMPDLEEIRKGIKALERTDFTELRLIKPTLSGIFNDPETLALAAYNASLNEGRSVYVLAQALDASKPTNELRKTDNCPKKEHILEYRWLPIDIDGKNPAKGLQSATDEEKLACFEVALQVRTFLTGLNIPTVFNDSGNGYHILAPLSIPMDDSAEDLVREVLQAFDKVFSVAKVAEVDTSLYSAAQLLKLPGTVAVKGVNTEERPWRISKVLDAPVIRERLNKEALEKLLAILKQKMTPEQISEIERPEGVDAEDATDEKIQRNVRNVERLLKFGKFQHTSAIREEDHLGFTYKWFLTDPCPFPHSSEHTAHKTYVYVNQAGVMGFYCHGDQCQKVAPPDRYRRFEAEALKRGGGSGWFGKAPGWEYPAESEDKEAPKESAWKRDRVFGKKQDYVFGPVEKMFGGGAGGIFPRSSVSLIGGPSGTGKTTFMIPGLACQALGLPYLEHPTQKLPYLIIMVDRGGFDLEETLDRLKLGPEVRANVVGLEYCVDLGAVSAVKKAIEGREVLPAVVFVEGMDILVSEQGKMTGVAAFLGALGEIAAYYHIAIIGSVGSPKLKKGEDFASDRDALYGSAVWARMTSTVIRMTKAEDKLLGEVVKVIIMPRHSMVERLTMKFSAEGQLVLIDEAIPPPPESPVLTFARERAATTRPELVWWTRKEAQDALGLSKAQACREVEDAKRQGWLREKPGPQGRTPAYALAPVSSSHETVGG